MTKLKNDLYNLRYGILLAIIYFIITQSIFHEICPLQILFHIECPACGLTRATIALITLHFKDAFNYNYTIYLWLPTIILFIVDRYFHPLKIKPFPVLFIITSIITIIRYIIKIFI